MIDDADPSRAAYISGVGFSGLGSRRNRRPSVVVCVHSTFPDGDDAGGGGGSVPPSSPMLRGDSRL